MLKLSIGEMVISEQKTTPIQGEKGMWYYGYNEEKMVNLRDSVPGIVKEESKLRLYIDLNIENDFGEKNFRA